MTAIAAASPSALSGPSALWYLTRGTGAVSLVLLTLSVVLGVVNVRRVRTPEVPRFVFDSLHRTASLLAIAFLAVHIVTAVADGFAPIRLLDVVVPFGSAYRPLWLGLGALAFDLLVAVALTSMLRRRFGYRAWRATHWLAYASWPIALLHGLGTGSDTRATWMLLLTGTCVIAVIVAVIARATAGWPHHAGARTAALAGSALVPLGLLAWLPSGPLAAGWPKRAGTPAALLRAASVPAGASAGSATATTGSGSNASTSFSAQASGVVHQAQLEDGRSEVHIALTIPGQQLGSLGIRIFGAAAGGGGVAMTDSRVSLGTSSDPERYRGRVTALDGTSIAAVVRDAAGTRLRVLAQLQIDQNSGAATGTVTASPTGGP